MANIYDLTEDMLRLQMMMEEGTLDEDALKDALDVTKEELAIKLEGYCKFIKNCESDIAGLRAEEKRLAEKRHTIENTIERCKDAMKFAVLTAEPKDKKMSAGTFTVGVQRNAPSVIIDDPSLDGFPERYLVPQEPTINKKLILEDFKNDGVIADLEGIAHIEQTESVRIR